MDELKTMISPGLQSAHGFKITPQEWAQAQADKYNRGVGYLAEQDGYNCDRCKNKGYVAAVYHDEQFGYYTQELVPCACQRIRKALQRLNRSGLSNVAKRYTFAQYETTEPWQQAIKTAAEKFCKDDANNWFFIGGQSGAGKSHICTAIALHYIRTGKDTRYMLWRDEITRLKACITDSEEYAAMIGELKNAEVLYIDDLFKSGKTPDGRPATPTAADINAAFEIINYRYGRSELITIISSEKTLTDLLQVDEAIAGRIAEKTKEGSYCLNLKPDKNRNYRLKGVIEL